MNGRGRPKRISAAVFDDAGLAGSKWLAEEERCRRGARGSWSPAVKTEQLGRGPERRRPGRPISRAGHFEIQWGRACGYQGFREKSPSPLNRLPSVPGNPVQQIQTDCLFRGFSQWSLEAELTSYLMVEWRRLSWRSKLPSQPAGDRKAGAFGERRSARSRLTLRRALNECLDGRGFRVSEQIWVKLFRAESPVR